MSKSSASEGLLHVNCNVTNQTQTCFWSTQVADCLPGRWVLVLYWRPFDFFAVIVESLLHIFALFEVFCSCFGTFCTEGNAVGFKFHFDMWYSITFAKSHSAECLLHKWTWWGAASKSAPLKCTAGRCVYTYVCLTAGQCVYTYVGTNSVASFLTWKYLIWKHHPTLVIEIIVMGWCLLLLFVCFYKKQTNWKVKKAKISKTYNYMIYASLNVLRFKSTHLYKSSMSPTLMATGFVQLRFLML